MGLLFLVGEKSNGIPQNTCDPVGNSDTDWAVFDCQYWESEREALINEVSGIVLNFGIGVSPFQ